MKLRSLFVTVAFCAASACAFADGTTVVNGSGNATLALGTPTNTFTFSDLTIEKLGTVNSVTLLKNNASFASAVSDGDGIFFFGPLGVLNPATWTLSIDAIGSWKTVYTITSAAPIPEPETYALMIAGLAAVGFMARRRSA